MRTSVKRAVVVGTAVAVVGGAGAAWAAWNAHGQGNAHGKATAAKELVVTEADAAATLYPGATGDAFIKIENPNNYPVKVTTIKWAAADGVTATDGVGTCTVTGVTFGDADGAVSNLALTLAGNSSSSFTLAGAVRMSNASENGCQNAKFSFKVDVTGASAAN